MTGRGARRGTRTASSGVAGILLLWHVVGCAAAPPSSPEPVGGATAGAAEELRVHFIDAGQGDATLLVAPGVTVLVDTGRHTATDVVEYLERHGVERIDLLAVTHPHADHIGQFDRVLERFAVTEVWWSPATHTTQTFDRSLTALEDSEAAYEEPASGDRAVVGPLRFDVVNPPRGGSGADRHSADLHETGLAFRVTYGDVAFLFTGDIEEATEARMVADHPEAVDADVYQVGHHGSSTSTSEAFLAAVTPQVAVYSAGAGNSYGHPHAEVVARLVGAGVALYGTDVHGTVVVATDGTDVRVEAETTAPPRMPAEEPR